MVNNFFKEYKKYIISFLSVIAMSLSLVFYFLDNEKKEEKPILKQEFIKKTDVYVEPINYQDKIITEEKSFEETEKVEIEEKTAKVDNITQEIIETEKVEKIILISTNSEKNRYSLKLIASKKIESTDKKVDFFTITGTITNGYDEDVFPLSVNEKYLEDISVLSLEIEDKKNNIKSTCDGYFLDSLSKGFSYHMKVDFIEEQSECYIVYQSDFVDEEYYTKEKKYAEIKDGVIGELSDRQIEFTNKKMQIKELLKNEY